MKSSNRFLVHCALACSIILSIQSSHSAFGAGVSSYGIAKIQSWVQTGDTVAPDSAGAISFRAFVNSAGGGDMMAAILGLPNEGFRMLTMSSAGAAIEEYYATDAAFIAAHGEGDYNLVINTTTEPFFMSAVLALPAGSIVSKPRIQNLSAGQTIDPSAPFVLSWDPLVNGSADDLVQLVIRGSAGIVFSTPWFGAASALNGAAASTTIPPGTLEPAKTYTAVLTHYTTDGLDSDSIAGAIGIAALASATKFELKTTGQDTVAPVLSTVTPANGAVGIATDTAVAFTFSKPMRADRTIAWNTTLDPAKFSYAWSADGKTLTARYSELFPAQTLITWQLDNATFKDLAGNALAGATAGAFMTGTEITPPPNPCDTNVISGDGGALIIGKTIQYIQTSSAAPVIDPESGAMFSASVHSPTNNPVTEATLQLPNGSTRPLMSNPFVPRSFFLFESFETQAQLDAAFPPGQYTLSVRRRDTGAATISAQFPAAISPPTPQIANHAEMQSINPNNDFTLRWEPFSGAVVGTDNIRVELHDDRGFSFEAPDVCIPRELAVTDVSIVIPKNSLSGPVYDGTLSFSKVFLVDTNTFPDMPAFASYSKSTSFQARTSGGNNGGPVAPRFIQFGRTENDMFQARVSSQLGIVYVVETSTDLIVWSPLTTIPAVGETIEFTDKIQSGDSYRFYRVRTGP